MASKININLDTSKENYLVAKCKQNDDLTLEASIFENGLALDLTNKTITIQALKSDNTYIIQNTDIVKENNKINAELDRDFSRVPGTTKIEIVLVESSKQNTTFSFYLEVVGSVIRGAVQSSNTATILEALDNKIIEAGQVKQETEELVQSGGAATKGEVQEINASLEEKAQKDDVDASFLQKANISGQVFTGDVKVKKDDAYLTVEDMFGRRLGMHTNGGTAWLHFFNASSGVISDITMTSDGVISSGGNVLNKVPSCECYHSVAIGYPANAGTKIILPWDSILFQSQPGMCGNAGTSANIVIPYTGIYNISCTIELSNATGKVYANLSRNNQYFVCSSYVTLSSTGSATLHLNAMYQMNQGDYFQVHLYNEGTTTVYVENGSRFQTYMVRGTI